MELAEPSVSHAAAFWGLVGIMALSPGEVLLPIYMSAAGEGAGVLALLTLAFALGTVLGMTVFTLLARAGASILRLERWARYEGAVLGLALIVIGLLIVTHQH
jgi:cytochrome c biogenesis protein CcdA